MHVKTLQSICQVMVDQHFTVFGMFSKFLKGLILSDEEQTNHTHHDTYAGKRQQG